MNSLEVALPSDADICYGIIHDARKFQNEQGFTQWTDDYPNMDTIRQDIESGKGYVLKVDGAIAGYLCVDFGGEPAYGSIQGAWRTDEPYAVVHRMGLCSAFRGRGLADTAFALVDELCQKQNVKSIRVDTDPSNQRMQHILSKNGFVHCGAVVFQGSEKMAFDKSL